MPTAKELSCIPWIQRLSEAQEYIYTYINEDEPDLYGLGYAMDLINSVIKDNDNERRQHYKKYSNRDSNSLLASNDR